MRPEHADSTGRRRTITPGSVTTISVAATLLFIAPCLFMQQGRDHEEAIMCPNQGRCVSQKGRRRYAGGDAGRKMRISMMSGSARISIESIIVNICVPCWALIYFGHAKDGEQGSSRKPSFKPRLTALVFSWIQVSARSIGASYILPSTSLPTTMSSYSFALAVSRR